MLNNIFFLKSAKIFLFAAAFTPLVYKANIIYPYLTGKLFFLRFAVEFALISFIIYKAFSINSFEELKNNFKSFFGVYRKNFLFIALVVFFISLIISAIFAVNPYRAFWGNLERGEGLINFFHYFILLLLMLGLFERRDWLNFFSISLGVGIITVFYGFFQSANIMNFPFMPQWGAVERVGSFIGNPAFFAAYLMLVIAIGGIVVKFIFGKWLKGLIYSAMALSFLMIFFTRTRGALLGLAVGIFVLLIYFSIYGHRKSLGLTMSPKLSLQKISIFLLISLIIFIGIFWFTKSNSFWQILPGFDRLARNDFLNSNDASIQTRLIAWRASFEAFKEKPFIGWGPEGYLTAYSKYYNPKYAVYGETWLDRSHNKFIDVLVMQGIFGISAYFILIGLLFRAFWRQPLVLASLIAYFAQNIFVFEEINSYALFYPLMGFAIAFLVDKNKNKPEEIFVKEIVSVEEVKNINFSTHYFQLFIAAALAIAMLIFGYFYNYIPYLQAKSANLIYNTQAVAKNQEAISRELKRIFYPYNFIQSSIRTTLTDRFYDSFVFENPELQSLAQSLESAIDELIIFEPFYDPRFYIRKSQISFNRAKVGDSLRFYQQAESASREAVKMAPQRQEAYYGLAFALAGQNRVEEAVQAAQSAVDLQPNVARAYYHLGLMQAVSKKKSEALKSFEIMQELDPDLSSILQFDGGATSLIISYKIIGSFDKLAELVIKRIDGRNAINISKNDYILALKYFADKHNAENFIKIAQHLRQFPEMKEDMEILIDLAEKENWEIILNL